MTALSNVHFNRRMAQDASSMPSSSIESNQNQLLPKPPKPAGHCRIACLCMVLLGTSMPVGCGEHPRLQALQLKMACDSGSSQQLPVPESNSKPRFACEQVSEDTDEKQGNFQNALPRISECETAVVPVEGLLPFVMLPSGRELLLGQLRGT